MSAPRYRTAPWVVVIGLALSVVAACGADAGPEADSEPTTTAPATTAASPVTSEATTTTATAPEDDDLALRQEALDRVAAYFEAMNAGEVDRMEEIIGEPLSEARRRHFEFHSIFKTAGFQWVVGECEVTNVIGSMALVDCPMENQNPAFVATGSSSVIAPFQLRGDVLRDQMWTPLGAPFEDALSAMVEYLEAFHPDDYTRACDPATQTGEFTEHGGIARVPECGEVLRDHVHDIAAWVEAGRPTDWEE